jgi:5'-nucleotidase
MGLEITSVGNHEFDEGKDELLRMQNGGCHPKAGCQGPHKFAGARFRYLAASTIVRSTGKTLFPAYEVKEFDGIPVAFIGLTLKNTPNVVSPSGVAGLEFRDEAETINALVPEIRRRGIEAIVVLIHEGGFPTGGYNECPGISGPIVNIVGKLDKAVDLVVSGHTHRAYTCIIDGRLVTSADKFGTLVTQIDLELDPKTRDVVSAKADNLIVRTDAYAKDPEQTALIAAYEALVRPPAERPVGSITATLTRDENAAGESVLGEIITDGRHPHEPADERERRGDLCRDLCRPAIRQLPGHAHPDWGANQGAAGAAVAGPAKAAHPASLQGLLIHMGRQAAPRRLRGGGWDHARREHHRSGGQVSGYDQRLSGRRG